MARNSVIINELFDEYVALRYAGFSFEQTMDHFSYLHAVTLSRLKKKISESPAREDSYLGIIDMEKRRAEAAEEKTEPEIQLEPSLAPPTRKLA